MSFRRAVLLLPAVWLAVGLALPACSRSAPGVVGQPAWLTQIGDLRPAAVPQGTTLRAVATTSLVSDLVQHVAGEGIVLTTLLPFGIDPHTYEASPQDMRAVADADVVFISGLGLEESLYSILQNAGGGVPIVSLSERIVALELEGESGGLDPHVWLDPNNMVIWAVNAAQALGALDPSRADRVLADSRRYQAELADLDGWIRAQVAQIPGPERRLVTDHDELGYFAARYGFEVVGALIPAYSTAAEPSAQELSLLEATIRALGVKAVFVGTGVNQELAARVAEDTGVRLVTLYTHSLGGPEGPVGSYLGLMEYNVNAIVEALR